MANNEVKTTENQTVSIVTDIESNSTVVTTFKHDGEKPRDIASEQASVIFEIQSWEHGRSNEYPSIGEQLGALYESRQGNDKPIKDIDDRIKAVKAKYPKPDFDKLEAKLKELEAENPKPTQPPTQVGDEEKSSEE